MATTIKIKNSATPSSTPSSLEQGEMALNVTDGRLFYGSGSGNEVKEFTGTTIDTGSFATTGSNTFIGDQIITGSVEITGAITASALSASYIDFDGTTPAYADGRLFYDSGNGALGFYNEEADVTLQIGQEFWVYGKNDSGQILANGTPVRISGANGANMLFAPAIAEDHTTASVYENHLIGLITHEVGINGFGYATVQGIVRSVNTEDFTAGDILYLQTGSGGFRNTPPPFPYDIVQIGFVKRAQSQNGEIFVKVQEPVHFNNISGISGSASEPGDLWIYRSNNAWSPGKTLSGSYVIDNGNLNVQGNITASAITSSGQIYGQVGVNEYNTSNLPASNTYSGDVIKLLSVSGLSTQRVYYLNNTTWTLAQSIAESTSDNMLAIAIGSNSDQGMLLRGLYRFTYNPGGNPGDPLYLSLTGGTVTSTAPSGTGEVVRIIGYKVDTNTIYFNPSNDYIVLA